MQIVEITVRAWDVPMRTPYRSAQRTTTVAHNVLVTLRLDTGSVGYGESAPARYVTGETQNSVAGDLGDAIPTLLGRAADDPNAIPAALSPGARGALETALADARARALGLPLFRVLGGAAETDTVRVTDLSLPILPPAQAGARAAQAAQNGFRALKIKVGAGETDQARVRAVADAAPHATLRLDGNQGFAPGEAVRLADALFDLAPRIELFEQPTKAGDDEALAFVAARVPFPVFADESVHNASDARRLLTRGACRGVVLKLAKSGLHESAEIARAVHAAGGSCLLGCMMETRIGIAAALHLALALGPAVTLFDLDGHLLVSDEGLVTGSGLQQTGDVLRVDPVAPGLGLSACS